MATPLGGQGASGSGASGSPVSQTPSDTTLRRASKTPVSSRSQHDGSSGDKPMTAKHHPRQQHKEAPPPHFGRGLRRQMPMAMEPGTSQHQIPVPTVVYPTGDSRQPFMTGPGDNPASTIPLARRDDRPQHPRQHPHAHQHHVHPAAVHGYASTDPTQFIPPHAIAATIPADSVRYGDQTQFSAMRPALFPPHIYYTSALGAEFTVDPNQSPVFSGPGMPTARPANFTGQTAAYHATPSTAPVPPQAAWAGSAMTQPFYGTYPAIASAPQHGAPQPPIPDELARQGSVFMPPGTGWSPSQVMSTPYQFYNPFQASSPQVDKPLDPLSPSPDAWSPTLGGGGSSQPGGQIRRASAIPQSSWPASVPSVRPPQSSAPGDEGPKSTSHLGGAERERKDYHPQPPARRSEWVMWVGNVPSNVSHEELWRFFSNTVPPPSSPNVEQWRGPSSIFLISRSSCAFVNFSSQVDLDRAVPYFNGLSLRPWDSRCPRMVCRIRHKDDDLRSGVGAQRGVGMHRAWVEQHKSEAKSEQLPRRMPTIGVSPKSTMLELPQPPREDSQHSSSSAHKSSASYSSTNSSFLMHHFPERYFILKSLSAADLQESVKTGLWKTQRHNQPILDQAFRTSQHVYLIFGANRSGEFFGYAKMTGASRRHKPASERPVVNRGSYQSARSSMLGLSTSPAGQPAPIREEEEKEATSPTQEVVSPTAQHRAATYTPRSQTDPFLLGGNLASGLDERRATSPGMIPVEEETETVVEQITVEQIHADSPVAQFIAQHEDFHAQDAMPRSESPDLMEESLRRMSNMTLDPNILRGERADSRIRLLSVEHSNSLQVFPRRENTAEVPRPLRQSTLAPPAAGSGSSGSDGGDNSLAQPFRIQWIKVAPLSFSRTRQLRNPWNGDREVKVSRDGTEVEPGVGAALLAEWDKLDQPATKEDDSKTHSDTDTEVKDESGATEEEHMQNPQKPKPKQNEDVDE